MKVFYKFFFIILLMASITIRILAIILNTNVYEFSINGIVIPYDFALFMFVIFFYFMYIIDLKRLNKIINFIYEKFKFKNTSR